MPKSVLEILKHLATKPDSALRILCQLGEWVLQMSVSSNVGGVKNFSSILIPALRVPELNIDCERALVGLAHSSTRAKSRSSAVGDFTNDGELDLVVADAGTNIIPVLISETRDSTR